MASSLPRYVIVGKKPVSIWNDHESKKQQSQTQRREIANSQSAHKSLQKSVNLLYRANRIVEGIRGEKQ